MDGWLRSVAWGPGQGWKVAFCQHKCFPGSQVFLSFIHDQLPRRQQFNPLYLGSLHVGKGFRTYLRYLPDHG